MVYVLLIKLDKELKSLNTVSTFLLKFIYQLLKSKFDVKTLENQIKNCIIDSVSIDFNYSFCTDLLVCDLINSTSRQQTRLYLAFLSYFHEFSFDSFVLESVCQQTHHLNNITYGAIRHSASHRSLICKLWIPFLLFFLTLSYFALFCMN